MSLSSLSAYAIERDHGRPRAVTRASAALGHPPETPASTEPVGLAKAITTAIPTEPLALYTAASAAIVAAIEPTKDWIELRWLLYAVVLVYIPAFLIATYLRANPKSRRRRKLPVSEPLAATVAFAGWGLVMPGSPLLAHLHGNAVTIWTVFITTVTAALLTLLGIPLQSQVSSTPTAPEQANGAEANHQQDEHHG